MTILHSANGKAIGPTNPLPTYRLDSAGNPVENTEGVLLASAARTTAVVSPNQPNSNASGVVLYLDVTANPGGTETLNFGLVLRAGVSGKNTFMFASFTIPAATNGTFALMIDRGANATVDNPTRNKAMALSVPRSWFAQVTPSGAGSWTYSLEHAYLV